MNLLKAALYDPAGAVSKATSSLLAMTAFDTTNLRLAITVPAHGMVRFRLRCVITGATTVPTIFLGVLNGATVVGRVIPQFGPFTANATTQDFHCDAEFTATGLTPGAMNVDAAYGVEVVVAATNIKYGGPNNTTTNDAWGAFVFEAWDPQPLTTTGQLSVDANGRVDVGKVLGTAQTAGDLKASLNTLQVDTDDIQARLPAALVSGRIDASVGAMAANVLTATAINADAITAAKIADGAIDAATFAAGAINAAAIAADAIGASELATDAVTEIANAVWDTDATGRQTQGSFGQAIGDPVADTNTIFKAVVTDATGATVGVDVVAVKAETAAILADTVEIGTAGAGLTAINLPNQTMDIVGSITGNLSGSVGSVTGLTAADVGAIKAKTDNFPTDPADESFIITATDAIMTRLGAPAVSVSADIAAVKVDSAAILVDTGTTLDGRLPAALSASGNIKADIKEVNDVTIVGNGAGTPWGP